ncbi:GroES-like protein [Aspergillus campestris IBT 28561]|uniref:GroES-like protein n=1 Tax=Aspergillus campestris (strain IBT 28561) TaxID=1392248 RepID=A0A2I1D0M6_ASPC2|nr:GroES-like protein [Aspergillus campestris IBT 28561]PKY03429.1 GroES-like protein [Aspergillus campestris IBT 28561]
MATQKAVVVIAPERAGLVSDRPLPTLRDDYILVKTEAVALNPTDWKHIAFLAAPGCLVGCDYAGVVQEVGKAVQKPFRRGDRIAGVAHGGNVVQHEDGAFAEYIVVKGDVQMHIPETLSFQEAAALGVGIVTVGQGLYQSLKLALPTAPRETPEPLLIYGGSTATGTLAIQFAKLSGYRVLTTCSPHNFGLVQGLGADAVYDYHDPTSAAAIRAATGDRLQLVFDTIAIEDSAKYCDTAISTQGGEYSALLPVSVERENVNSRWTVGYTIMGEDFMFGPDFWAARPEDKAFAEEFWTIAEPLLAAGIIKPHPIEVKPGGLQGVLDGLQLLQADKVSGKKLVYNISETP